jgi:uncharacterized oxidoreductase
MKFTENTILVTGGASGIGLALASAFHAQGNQVIIAGRRAGALAAAAASRPGMRTAVLDIDDAAAITAFAARLTRELPSLNMVIHSAGIMQSEDLASGDTATAEHTISTNLLGPIRLNAALLPHLLARERAAIMTVSSGLAFVPRADTPAYNATKAAIHSYTQSLRYQLRHSAVDVLELIPPYVQTELMGEQQARDPDAMALADFIAEVMDILQSRPGETEICVERVKPLRFAAARADYETFFSTFNDTMAARDKSAAIGATGASHAST